MADPMTSLEDLQQIVDPVADVAPSEPQLDRYGRAYGTGRRKNAVARVWIKPGRGEIKVNGRDVERFLPGQPCVWSSTSPSTSPTAPVSTT